MNADLIQLLENYKKAYDSESFKSTLNPHGNYSMIKIIRRWEQNQFEQLKDENKLEPYYDFLERFIKSLIKVTEDVVRIYTHVHKESGLKLIKIYQARIIEVLESPQFRITYDSVINLSLHSNDVVFSNELKLYFLTIFDQCVENLKTNLYIDVYLSPLKIYFQIIRHEINNSVENLTSSPSNKQNIDQLNWFKVGLLFATGEMDGLKIKHKNNSTHIARDKFGEEWESFRPYISESISNTNVNDKNVFSNKGKMLKIIKHCKKHKLNVTPDFINRLPSE